MSDATGWLVAAAVLAHDMADGANMVGLASIAGRSRAVHPWLAINAGAPLAGVAIGQSIHLDLTRFSLLLALFAGGFLYIGTAELLPRSRVAGSGLATSMASLAGIMLMAGVVHAAG